MTPATLPAGPRHATPDGPTGGNNFHLIRLCLASSVILSHAPQLADGDRHREPLTRLFGTLSLGELAVYAFFMVSGYLVYQSLERSTSVASFLLKRVLRIYPGFVAASLLSVLVVGWLGARGTGYLLSIRPAELLQNAATLATPAHPACFAGTPYPLVNGSLWTIQYEFACYLALGLVWCLRPMRKPGVWLALWLAALVTMVAQTRGLIVVHGWPVVMPRFAACFLAGVCYCLFSDRVRLGWQLGVPAALVLTVCLMRWNTWQLALPVLGGYLLFWAAFAKIRCIRACAGWPDVSYGVYLYAWPINKLVLWYMPGVNVWLACALVWTLSLCCGAASWYLVERPFMRLKGRLRRRGADADRLDAASLRAAA